jgi:murein tripeptide amidase MpaA
MITSRVHPGETGASYMMQGVIDYLVGPSIGAKILRDNFLIKIVPMLNIDGVINGNTRCSIVGVDLNRYWQDPSRELHPVIFTVKWLIKRFAEERNLLLFCDFHGHSRKKNIFMYGNSTKNDTKYKERIFPYMLEKQSEVFNYSDCAFNV